MASIRRDKCQMRFENLLLHLDSLKRSDATRHRFIISDIIDTKTCDIYYNMESIRNETVRLININDDKRIDRICGLDKLDDEDISIMIDRSLKLETLYKEELNASLCWNKWIKYRLLNNPNNFYSLMMSASIAGFIGSIFGLSIRRATFLSMAPVLSKWISKHKEVK